MQNRLKRFVFFGYPRFFDWQTGETLPAYAKAKKAFDLTFNLQSVNTTLAWLDNYFLFENERKFEQFFLSKESIDHMSDNIVLSMTNAYDGESLIIAEYGENPEIFKT